MAGREHPLTKLLGDVLHSKNGGDIPSASLAKEGRVIGLYCSAKWCPPCRVFTPAVIEFYETWKSGSRADLLELVFISSDNDETKYDEYYAEMPWPALPYHRKNHKVAITRRYKVTGIPSLVFIDSVSGRLITNEGRNVIHSDPYGEAFPWRPKPLMDYMRDAKFVSNNGQTVRYTDLKGKVLGFYFSADWCPPCRQFTPLLVSFYNAVKKRTKDSKLELILVSSDHDEASFKSYHTDLPFLAVDFNDPLRTALGPAMNITGIPRIAFYNEKMELITEDGRVAVVGDPEGKEFPWKYKPVNILKERFGRILNEQICLLFLTDGKEESMQAALAALRPVAEKDRANGPGDLDQSMHYFVTTPDEAVTQTVAEHLSLPSDRPLVVIMDCSTREWVSYNGSLDARGMEMFVGNYREDKLPKQVIGRGD